MPADIRCLTHDSIRDPWVNFEAGTLSKAVDKSRVSPLLFHLKPSDIDQNSPLLQFQSTTCNKADSSSSWLQRGPPLRALRALRAGVNR